MSPKIVDHTFVNDLTIASQDALKDQGYFDSGCSRHMTGNISYLTDFKEHDGGYVTFGGGAKGGKITSKGKIKTDHLLKQVRGNLSRPVQTRRQLATDPEMCMFTLTEKLHKFDRIQVWELVDKPFGKTIIKLKWLWKNKKDEGQTMIRNKARLVAKRYAQEEGIDFEELFAPVALIAGFPPFFTCRATKQYASTPFE
uniref:Uncharacterized protein n=1 Tax=Tanacetum cinerariifolium TaxID=118510 RepID=A0A699LD20_TANCI|nr:hypothetical protein [Tanacetum cinerariifolium]